MLLAPEGSLWQVVKTRQEITALEVQGGQEGRPLSEVAVVAHHQLRQ